VFLQIAEHCNREVFNALIGTEFPGIVVSDRSNGYSHLDPQRRQACWSHHGNSRLMGAMRGNVLQVA
jgi:hypothetical protein